MAADLLWNFTDRRVGGARVGLGLPIAVDSSVFRSIPARRAAANGALMNREAVSSDIPAASIRSANHMSDCAKVGADVATAPPNVIKAMANHVLTDKGLDAFMKEQRSALS